MLFSRTYLRVRGRMTELPNWAVHAGVPSAHITAAAVRVARMLDRNGSEVSDLRRSYRQHASGAYYPEPDMIKGETLLVDCGLAHRTGSRLVPSGALLNLQLEDESEAVTEITAHALFQLPQATTAEQLADLVEAAIPSAERREELLLALGAKFDDTYARLIGEIGEELVVEAARRELLAVGHPDLASRVRRVSLGSDALGYDVTAPRPTGSTRLFEAKASTKEHDAEFFLSRIEWETGARFVDDWFLVYCRVSDPTARTGEVVGWCDAHVLSDVVPIDQGSGTWSSVHVMLPNSRLEAGLPR